MRLPGCRRAKWLPERQYAAAATTTAFFDPSQLEPAVSIERTALELQSTTFQPAPCQRTAFQSEPATERAGRTG